MLPGFNEKLYFPSGMSPDDAHKLFMLEIEAHRDIPVGQKLNVYSYCVMIHILHDLMQDLGGTDSREFQTASKSLARYLAILTANDDDEQLMKWTKEVLRSISDKIAKIHDLPNNPRFDPNMN